jgi:hypothetical protein
MMCGWQGIKFFGEVIFSTVESNNVHYMSDPAAQPLDHAHWKL